MEVREGLRAVLAFHPAAWLHQLMHTGVTEDVEGLCRGPVSSRSPLNWAGLAALHGMACSLYFRASNVITSLSCTCVHCSAQVSSLDLERLEDEEYLNDTVIDFYLL